MIALYFGTLALCLIAATVAYQWHVWRLARQ